MLRPNFLTRLLPPLAALVLANRATNPVTGKSGFAIMSGSEEDLRVMNGLYPTGKPVLAER